MISITFRMSDGSRYDIQSYLIHDNLVDGFLVVETGNTKLYLNLLHIVSVEKREVDGEEEKG